MSDIFRPIRRTIEVEQGQLPTPATKLVITQHLEAYQDPPFWAWMIVGAFYDRQDNIIWSTKVFAGHLNIELESDDEDTDSAESQFQPAEPERLSSPDLQLLNENSRNEPQFQYFQRTSQAHHPEISFPPLPPPVSWDPTHQGPVPGHWQASFNPSIRRWVHTWQPFH